MNFYTFYTYLLWLLAYIYASTQQLISESLVLYSKATKATKSAYKKYFRNNTTDTTNKIDEETDKKKSSIYMTDGQQMFPFSFDISKLHKHHLLYYVVIRIDDTHNKVIIFNNLDKLIFIYNNLKDLVKSRISKFSKFLEVKTTSNLKIDYLDVFTEYTDRSDNYFNEISGYNIKARDIYDFNNNRFVISHGNKLYVTKMDLSSHEYNYEDYLGF